MCKSFAIREKPAVYRQTATTFALQFCAISHYIINVIGFYVKVVGAGVQDIHK
jgi:hypothetical protein